MDEIDAALDFRNVSIVANYIKERTQDAQFIIISLRNNMFELADRLVGIYKTHDVTKNVTINPKAFAATAGSENPAASAAGGGKLAVRAPAAPAEALGDSTNVA
ncbi:SMC4 [Symbiodinium sp. KB8]|nr:SMC4 [Symbiodinium sp. KB8]